MADVLGFLKKAAPWITAAATCNVPALVGLAAQSVSSVTGSKVSSTPEAIAAAIAGATPEQMLALKQVDADLQLKLQAMNFQNIEDIDKIAADDRASARQREMTIRDRVPACLAGAITLGFFAILAYMLKFGIPKDGHDALLLMLGSLGTAWAGVVTYYFGSSAGSAAKTELLAQAPPIAQK